MLSGWQATNTAKTVALLERERYAHDRLWDARREIYTDLIAKMRTFERAAGAVSDGFNDGELDPEAYFHSVGYDADNKNSVAAYRVLAEAYDDGRLMISETFAIRFELFLAGIYATDDEDPPARATIAFDAAATAHADLLAIALAEIAPKI